MLDKFLDFSFSSRKNSLTLREFIKIKDNKDIVNKYNKHIIGLFKYLLKNGLTISREDFIKDYNKGMSLKEISSKYHIPYDYLLLIKMAYGIKAKGSTFIKRKKTEIKLSKRQKDIIYGSLMGDAKKESYASVGFVHGPSQKEYIEWKFRELNNISPINSLKLRINKDKKRNKVYESYRFYTRANSCIESIIKIFYFSGKKEINREILDNMSDLSVAVWYMDDGYTDWGKRFRDNGIKAKEVYSFCTDSFSKESNNIIIDWFKAKYNIDSYLNSRNRIIIKNKSSDSLNKIINKHIIESMRYKIDYNTYKEVQTSK